MSEMRYFETVLNLRWMHGAQCCSATLTSRIRAYSPEHATIRALDQTREWFRGEIEDARVEEVIDA